MCGIVGIRSFDEAAPDRGLLARMATEIVHRGPDAHGFYTHGDVGFGHTRLSIIDLAGSPQPMELGDRYAITFNGEIFNYMDLRQELAAKGHEFRTDGDTEVLLALFAEYGPEGVTRAEGQFAYAIHDRQEDDLWLFRDRMGILPLYYVKEGKRFLFASEIKSLLVAIEGGPRVDDESLGEYLAYRSVPVPHTLFAGVRKLPPGHRLRIARDGTATLSAYWSLPTEPASHAISEDEAITRVETALEESVRSRLIADVPVGAYLSGGLDSSLCVALVRKLRGPGAAIESYSAGFSDPRFDELPYAREVSQALSTNHHEVLVEPSDFEELWQKLTWHRDAPLSEPADLAIHRLAQEAQGTVKVLLSGEGSDELFAGYPKHRFAGKAALASLLPPFLRTPLFRGLERVLPHSQYKLRTMLRAMTAKSEADRFQEWFAPFTEYERRALLGTGERKLHRAIHQRSQGDRIQRMLYCDCHTWLVDNLLERGDRMAMAASIESRPPFLDYRLAELAFRLPSRVKLHGDSTKWVVKEVARRHLPEHIVDRKKVGFRVPLDAWFRSGLESMAHDLLLSKDSFVADRFDRKLVAGLLDTHRRKRRNEELRIWTLLCLEVWHRVFFKGAYDCPHEPILAGSTIPGGQECAS